MPNDRCTQRFDTLKSVESVYRDDPSIHRLIYNSFTQTVEDNDWLIAHRLHVEKNKLGFGARAFHWLWKLIVDDVSSGFRFMEVGVYKGQVTSLISLLVARLNKPG